MGLDQYLTAKTTIVGSEYAPKESQETYNKVLSAVGASPVNKVSVSMATVGIEVAYWRKQNAIHKWFVDNVQNGVDECQESYVSREKLTTLLELCNRVIAEPSEAGTLLPSQSGFFFGSTDYDEWYHDGVKYTAETLTALLADPQYEGWEFYYQSSW